MENELAEARIGQFKDYELVDEFEMVKKSDYVVYNKQGKNNVGLVVEIDGLKTFKVLVDMEYKLIKARLASKVFFIDCVVYLKDRVFEKRIEVDVNSKMKLILEYEVNNALQDLFSVSNFAFVNGLRVKQVTKIEEEYNKEELVKKFQKAKVDISHVDIKKYYKIDEENEIIYVDEGAKFAQIPIFHNNPLEILLITPENLLGVQLYNDVKFSPATNLSCSVYSGSTIYVHGIGIYGPYPNTKGPQSFKFLLELENMKTGEISRNSLCIENEEPAIWKLFFSKPVLVREDEMFEVRCDENISKGLVYALQGDGPVFYGNDGVRFNLENYGNQFLASVYYTRI